MNVNQGYYLPQDRRAPDSQYKNLLTAVIEHGWWRETVQGPRALTYLSPKPLRYNLRNGVPLITERDLSGSPRNHPPLWQQAIGEILAYINGARTIADLESFGCYWWGLWAPSETRNWFGLAPGDMGEGFYGPAFRRFPMQDGGTFDQIKAVLNQLRHNPNTRTHVITPWIPQYCVGPTRKTMTTPCTGSLLFVVRQDHLDLIMTQRAADVPIGVPFNTFQYAVLLIMVAQIIGLIPGEFIHMIQDAHIYEPQLPASMKLLTNDARPFPILRVDSAVNDLFDFRVKHFALEEYTPHPAVNMGGAVV
jgi:thymidylate synthase